jgi:hypothetical protein
MKKLDWKNSVKKYKKKSGTSTKRNSFVGQIIYFNRIK